MSNVWFLLRINCVFVYAFIFLIFFIFLIIKGLFSLTRHARRQHVCKMDLADKVAHFEQLCSRVASGGDVAAQAELVALQESGN